MTMTLYKRIVGSLFEALDPLYPSLNQLKLADRDDVIDCTVLCTRSKIYTNGMNIIKLYKCKKFDEASLLTQRFLKQISIHRQQLYKLAKLGHTIDLSNLRYLKDLKTLFNRLANIQQI